MVRADDDCLFTAFIVYQYFLVIFLAQDRVKVAETAGFPFHSSFGDQ